MPIEESLDGLADRAGWTVDGDRATYRPQLGGWSARLVRVKGTRQPGHSRYDRWHVAIVDPAGAARQAKPWTYLLDAWRFAESRVDAENTRT